MKIRNIMLFSVLLVLAGLVFSPLNASAYKEAYGVCRTSKWGVTIKTDWKLIYTRNAKGYNDVYFWWAKVHAWGSGANIGHSATVAVSTYSNRKQIQPYKGWTPGNYGNIRTWPEDSVVVGMGMDVRQGRSTHRARCRTWITTR